MSFNQAISRLCTQEEPSDLILEPNQNVHYYDRQGMLVVSELFFASSDVAELLEAAKLSEWPQDGNASFSVGAHRVRANFFRTMGRTRAVLRRLPGVIPKPEDLGLPSQFLDAVCTARDGLMLVCGPMGSGKSTSLASAVQERLKRLDDHCVTIENPIEYLIEGRFPLQVSQREIGKCVESYAQGLKSALRQRAKTILVQEIIDTESAITALDAATTGHFVISTLHTGKVSLALESLMKLMPENLYRQKLTILPEVLRGVVCQRLIRKSQQPGMVAIYEVMRPDIAIWANVAKETFRSIDGIIENGSKMGHLSFKQSLNQLKAKGIIDQNRFAEESK